MGLPDIVWVDFIFELTLNRLSLFNSQLSINQGDGLGIAGTQYYRQKEACSPFPEFVQERVCSHCNYDTVASLKHSAFEYIEMFYNRKRLYQALGYVSPVE